ncbi:hypothetical protein AB833_17300 [Chromatiales bacterium (ex Bugula neritina AB1)]|nr:hypothetical protein AB833_17300 [Chromatiales bacterium (ex Bugula neritina AB1)]
MAVLDSVDNSPKEQPVRFFDSREKYLLFVTTTNEKWSIAQRINDELASLQPNPPALRVFDAGMGDAAVLTHVLRAMHDAHPHIPFLVAAKEISMEDVRLGLEKMADRFAEHPQMVVVITNMRYAEAPQLYPQRESDIPNLKRWDIALEGSTAKHFDSQLRGLSEIVREGWQTKPSEKTGNPLYVNPAMIVLYRQDQQFALDAVIPAAGPMTSGYDLIICAQPYRSRQPASVKVKTVVAPLARSLSAGGRLVVVQSTGYDPGMEIIRKIWSDERPFPTPRHDVIEGLKHELSDEQFLHCGVISDEGSLFKYQLHVLPEEMSHIGTSSLLAAWNAAVYVAQISDDRIDEAMQSSAYLEATREILEKHGGLWFLNESFVVTRD